MAIKTYKPYTPSRRGMTVTDYSGLSKDKPESSLLDAQAQARRAQPSGPADRTVAVAVATASTTAWWTSNASATMPRRSSRCSTTRTAVRSSRWCSTAMAS